MRTIYNQKIKAALLRHISYRDAEKIKNLIACILYYSGIAFILSLFLNKGAKILVYHSVSESHTFCDNRIPTHRFSEQLEFLHQKYKIIPLPKLISYIERFEIIDKNWVVLTFDDGYADNYETAYPLLKQHDACATYYLTCDMIDDQNHFFYDRLQYIFSKTAKTTLSINLNGNTTELPLLTDQEREDAAVNITMNIRYLPTREREGIVTQIEEKCKIKFNDGTPARPWYLKKDQIKHLNAGQIEFGSHTISHPNLTSLTHTEIDYEISESKRFLENLTGNSVHTFSIPYGKENNVSSNIAACITSAGYRSAVTTIPGQVISSTDRFNLPRIGAGDFPLYRLKTKLLGINI